MAPIRRRVSKRVVKTTFQECFEYDIPGFRTVPKRPIGPSSNNRTSIVSTKVKNQSQNPDSKQESTSKDASSKILKGVLKTKPLPRTEKLKEVAFKGKLKKSTLATGNQPETLNKLQSSVAKRIKAKNAFMGSDYKRFKTPQTKMKLKTHVSSTDKKNKVQKRVGSVSNRNASSGTDMNKSSSASVDSIFDSKNWQPVVHLEKLSVSEAESSKSHNSKTISPSRRRARSSASSSSDLVIRLHKALKDPLAQEVGPNSAMSDHEISNKTFSTVLKGTQSAEVSSSSVLSQQTHHDSDNVMSRDRSNLNTRILEGVFTHHALLSNPTASDSAMEDWPDDSTDASDGPEHKGGIDDVSSTEHDWATPHVALIMHWQKQFNCVTNDLRSSFDHLKGIIEEKNASIAILRKKLERYNDNTYHNILDHVIQDYDKNDATNPATVILNSILEYSNSYC